VAVEAVAVEAPVAAAQLEPLAQPQRELLAEPVPVRIGVVGTGSLGRHHVRILASLPGAELVGIHDARPEVAAELAATHGTVAFADVDALAAQVDAMVVAAPTTHICRQWSADASIPRVGASDRSNAWQGGADPVGALVSSNQIKVTLVDVSRSWDVEPSQKGIVC